MKRVKLIRLNEVQYADTAERVADLAFTGFEPVNEKKEEEPKVAAEEVTETEEAEEVTETEEEKPKKRGKKE
ncbi:MAG: hypothetical protein SOU94_03830 [Acidaminococcus sp.]|uniref:hypothetical protein n=1 Tax=Acidaminococcus sp. TaxID=1872103 RepID=UPI002A75683C|nr:hypothetical protein [Acidaminococcus sp.]MDY2738943.1 hypothetical protein [Acidaminococcus sp.]